MTGGTAARTETVDLHDFVEDDEFKCELDSVRQRLRGFFVYPLVGGHFTDDSDIESDAQDIKVNQDMLCVAHAFWVAW